MDLSTYFATFNFSDIKNTVVNEPFYVALGMTGESGEALQKVLQDDTPGLLLELGDTAWYVCKMAQVLGVIQPDVTATAATGTTLLETVARLCVETAAVADKVKKRLRDLPADWGIHALTDPTGGLYVTGHLNSALGFIAASAELAGSNFPTVLQLNRQKLLSRKRRNVIHGSGDNR